MSDLTACEHGLKIVIQSGTWTGSDEHHGNERIMICPDCGRLFASGHYNGHFWETSFRVDNPRHIEAMKRYAMAVYGEAEYQTILDMD